MIHYQIKNFLPPLLILWESIVDNVTDENVFGQVVFFADVFKAFNSMVFIIIFLVLQEVIGNLPSYFLRGLLVIVFFKIGSNNIRLVHWYLSWYYAFCIFIWWWTRILLFKIIRIQCIQQFLHLLFATVIFSIFICTIVFTWITRFFCLFVFLDIHICISSRRLWILSRSASFSWGLSEYWLWRYILLLEALTIYNNSFPINNLLPITIVLFNYILDLKSNSWWKSLNSSVSKQLIESMLNIVKVYWATAQWFLLLFVWSLIIFVLQFRISSFNNLLRNLSQHIAKNLNRLIINIFQKRSNASKYDSFRNLMMEPQFNYKLHISKELLLHSKFNLIFVKYIEHLLIEISFSVSSISFSHWLFSWLSFLFFFFLHLIELFLALH